MRVLILMAAALPLAAQTDGIEFFEKNVRPVFAAQCYACHGPKVQMAGLNLSTAAGIAKGADTGPLSARLAPAVGYTGKIKMPPSGKLPDEAVASLRTWLAMGAPVPKDTAPASDVASRKSHWSFQPVAHPAPPKVKNEA